MGLFDKWKKKSDDRPAELPNELPLEPKPKAPDAPSGDDALPSGLSGDAAEIAAEAAAREARDLAEARGGAAPPPQRAAAAAATAATAAAAAPKMRVFDALGRTLELPRDVYFAQLLTPALVRAQESAGPLAALLRNALNDGFSRELLPFTAKLLALGGDTAQARTLHGLAQLQAGDLAAAEATLAEVTGRGPWAASARQAEARIRERRGDPAGRMAKLHEAFDAEPNHATVFGELVRELEKAGGVEARRAWTLEQHGKQNGWRVSLFQAQEHLVAKELEPALAIYRAVLEKSGDVAEVMLTLLGDLGRHGHAKEAMELVGSRFDLAKHGAEAGLNFVRVCLDVGDFARGRMLLHHLALLPRPDLGPALDELTLAIDRKEREQKPAPAAGATPPAIALVVLQEPLFLQGLAGASFLLPGKGPNARTLAITPWATATGDARFARGAAALLAEQVWLHTGQRASLVVPVVPGQAIATLGTPIKAEQIAGLWPEKLRPSVVVVTMKHATTEVAETLEIELFDAARATIVGRKQLSVEKGQFEALLRAADAALRQMLEPGIQPAVLNGRAPIAPGRQVEALACALSLVLAGPQGPLYGVLAGERALIRRLMFQCEASPTVESLEVLFASILALRTLQGSDVPSEFVRALADWFGRASDDSNRARVAIAPLKALGQNALWRTRREKITAAAPPAARAWLEKLDGIRS
ncbi:MAG: hypothetical protein JNL90_11505 [Planctomycetes bacterium]|nr:hypothetical protein [Planctomycetota bacterium]